MELEKLLAILGFLAFLAFLVYMIYRLSLQQQALTTAEIEKAREIARRLG
ncbi:hypothetical protein J7J18_03775 [bacterium]|nr:hypothetical protein [bacterium]